MGIDMLGIDDGVTQIPAATMDQKSLENVTSANSSDIDIGKLLNGKDDATKAKHHHRKREIPHIIPTPRPMSPEEEKAAKEKQCYLNAQKGLNCDGTPKEDPGLRAKLTKWFNDFVHQFDVLNKNTSCSLKLKIFLNKNERDQLNLMFSDTEIKNKMAQIMVDEKQAKNCKEDAAALIKDKKTVNKIFNLVHQTAMKDPKYQDLDKLLMNHKDEFIGFVQSGGLTPYFKEGKN